MILNDFTVPKTRFSNEQLDSVLADLCEIVIKGQQDNPDFNGMVAAAVIDPKGRIVTGLNYLYGARRVHGERAAIDKYEAEYGNLPRGSIVVTTCSPCSCEFDDNREGPSCSHLLNSKGVKLAYCGFKDPTQKNTQDKFVTIITENSKLNQLCHKFADTFLHTEKIDEISADRLERYLARADQQVSNRMDRMSQARERLSKSYEIYHTDRPAGSSQIVDRFEADTPEQARQYYEKFIQNYDSDVDFDLRLRKGTGIMEYREPNNVWEDATSKQVLSYIKKIHPKGEFTIDQAITDHPAWELTSVPLSSLRIDTDDVSPYGQINYIDYDHVENITKQDIKNKPIVVDSNGWIIDGNHRAVAARDMGMTHIPAYVPVESDDDEETYDQHMARIKNENFADGKGPGRPGDSQRHGIPKGASIAQLEKASHAKGRKGQLARWQLNMRRGKKK